MHLSKGNKSPVSKCMFMKMAIYSAFSSDTYKVDISQNNFKVLWNYI